MICVACKPEPCWQAFKSSVSFSLREARIPWLSGMCFVCGRSSGESSGSSGGFGGRSLRPNCGTSKQNDVIQRLQHGATTIIQPQAMIFEESAIVAATKDFATIAPIRTSIATLHAIRNWPRSSAGQFRYNANKNKIVVVSFMHIQRDPFVDFLQRWEGRLSSNTSHGNGSDHCSTMGGFREAHTISQ